MGAEGERFELSRGFPLHAFQACALDRYANPPYEHNLTVKSRIQKASPVPQSSFYFMNVEILIEEPKLQESAFTEVHTQKNAVSSSEEVVHHP